MSLGTFLSPRDAAERLGLEKRAIYKAIDSGELKAYKIRGRIRISPPDFDAWLTTCAI